MLPNVHGNVTRSHENQSVLPKHEESSMPDPATSTNVPGGSIVPDWAPWGVLGALLAVGLLGGTGLMPMPNFRSLAAPASPNEASGSSVVVMRGAKPSSAAPAVASASADSEKIEVLHIVVSHAGTQLGKHHNITRTATEARKRAEEARARALKGEDFTALIAEYTDEPKASGRNGRIGPFRRKHAIQPFSDVAFALKVGEISAVTETELGLHVIKRTK